MLLTESADLTWPLDPPDKPSTPTATDEQWALAQQCAVEWLWSQTGRKFGTRTAVYRPQSLLCDRRSYYGALPYLTPLSVGAWPFVSDPRFGFQVVPFVLQLPGPVAANSADPPLVRADVVLYDDAVPPNVTALSTAGVNPPMRLDGDYLVRQDGVSFPLTQDLLSPLGSPNTWAINYMRGVVPPALGQRAVALLAAEWLKWIVGDKTCALPWNATNASRAGVAVQLQITTAYRTSGIGEVDRWVMSINPDGLRNEPRVWSPDTVRNQQPYAGSYLSYIPPLGSS